MKVLLTGAAGGIGRRVWQALLDDGCEVVATDRVAGEGLPGALAVRDLLDADAAPELTAGCEVVVHLAAHPGIRRRCRTRVFAENVSVSCNVFQASADAGVRQVIFASSVQVIASDPGRYDDVGAAYLPLDADSPARPTNQYALSKLIGEQQLRYHVSLGDFAAVALRLPSVLPATSVAAMRAQPPSQSTIAQGGAWIDPRDVGHLIIAILRRDLPGFRVYLPAAASTLFCCPPSESIDVYYQGVPLRCDREPMTCLVDIARLTAETGWRPRHAP